MLKLLTARKDAKDPATLEAINTLQAASARTAAASAATTTQQRQASPSKTKAGVRLPALGPGTSSFHHSTQPPPAGAGAGSAPVSPVLAPAPAADGIGVFDCCLLRIG